MLCRFLMQSYDGYSEVRALGWFGVVRDYCVHIDLLVGYWDLRAAVTYCGESDW